jgi:hypothetical protein
MRDRYLKHIKPKRLQRSKRLDNEPTNNNGKTGLGRFPRRLRSRIHLQISENTISYNEHVFLLVPSNKY